MARRYTAPIDYFSIFCHDRDSSFSNACDSGVNTTPGDIPNVVQ